MWTYTDPEDYMDRFTEPEYLSAWDIGVRANEAESVEAGFKLVRKLFRQQDESHLFPVNGRFNATERAIRRIRKAERDGLVIESPLEYALAIDAELSDIVNSDF